MTRPPLPPLPPLRVDELDLEAQPEVALLVSRRAIEGRLDWLIGYLAPDERQLKSDSVLDALGSRAGFDRKTKRAIRDVLAATNPVAHGRSVSPTAAAEVADSAARVSAALDDMILRLRGELGKLPPRTSLAYAFLALPSNTRKSIAKRLGLLQQDDESLSPKEFAGAVFERASKAKLLSELWRETARLRNDIPIDPPPELERNGDA